MRSLFLLLFFISTSALAEPRGMDFDVFIRLDRGMSEGELLSRAGAPDLLTIDGTEELSASSAVVSPPFVNRGRFTRTEVVKTYTYLPTLANPFTTVITLRGGRIVDLQRIKQF
jgi:hypothetical protein